MEQVDFTTNTFFFNLGLNIAIATFLIVAFFI